MSVESRDSSASDRRRTTSSEVEEFLASLHHSFKSEILVIRDIILAADPRIGEGIKWNAPSFRTTEYFATFHLQTRHGVQVILHRGAKRREASDRLAIDDPESLLSWLGNDRASVVLRNMSEIDARRDALTAIVRQWIEHV